MYGSPVSEEGGQTGWSDPNYSKYITLSRDEEGCLVTVGNYSVGITNVLASYPVSGGQAVISDPEDAAVWNYSQFDPPAGGQTEVGRVQPVYGRYQ